jgi:hypothetical protein
MVTWEYKTHRVPLATYSDRGVGKMYVESMSEAELMKLGAQGWELVSIVNLTDFNAPRGLEYIFKRPKP